MIICFAVLVLCCIIGYYIGYNTRKNEDREYFDTIVKSLVDCRGNTDADNRLISNVIRIANNRSVN